MESKQTPDWRVEHAPKGWGNTDVLYDHNNEEILNTRLAPDFDTLKFFEAQAKRVKDLEAEVARLKEERDRAQLDAAHDHADVLKLQSQVADLREALKCAMPFVPQDYESYEQITAALAKDRT